MGGNIETAREWYQEPLEILTTLQVSESKARSFGAIGQAGEPRLSVGRRSGILPLGI
ncbi:uncharacterized protein BO96DRAFT_415275 [Aspergillus niger CBS 101883]|uniref:uncharacterized protein n=1 Tax=Aspergillus lacticoffeatus (strain CBS 101883) TaxID=1450533 RepID=UPI000D7F73C8|nr:uncharacterized protein BO96DRAFT_415275 [Aspergillus niger CBS 101883]PYH52823.1 hypothetical protein BO96DRAFT_415275 [Aspergillus niger CBS 101883]